MDSYKNILLTINPLRLEISVQNKGAYSKPSKKNYFNTGHKLKLPNNLCLFKKLLHSKHVALSISKNNIDGIFLFALADESRDFHK